MFNPPSTPCPCCGRPTARQAISDIVRDIRLPPAQKRVLEAMARSMGELIPTDRLVDIAYGDDPDGGPLDARNCLAAHVKRMKPKLAGYGLAIEGGSGSKVGRRLVWMRGAAE